MPDWPRTAYGDAFLESGAARPGEQKWGNHRSGFNMYEAVFPCIRFIAEILGGVPFIVRHFCVGDAINSNGDALGRLTFFFQALREVKKSFVSSPGSSGLFSSNAANAWGRT